MSELAPPPPPSVRRGQALEALGQVERQIAMLETRKRLLIAQVHNDDRGGMYARYMRDELALVWRRSARACQH